MLKQFLPLYFIFLLIPAAASGESGFYDRLTSDYPGESYIIGIGEQKKSDNSIYDRRIAEIQARREIAEQIRIHIEEETIDVMCEKGSSKLFDDKQTCESEFTMVVRVTVNEFLEGSRIVNSGEKDGVFYAVAVMPRAEIVAMLDSKVESQINRTRTSLEKARNGDGQSVSDAQKEYMKAIAYERERELINGVKGRSAEVLEELQEEIVKLKENN